MARSLSSSSLVLITGLSGAGMSTALNILEDLGYFAIDNLPFPFFEATLQKYLHGPRHLRRLAVHMDSRDKDFLENFDRVLPRLKKMPALKILFFTASEAALIRRFSETRRRHPLAMRGNLVSGIRKERKLAEKWERSADHLIDTSDLTVHSLRAILQALLGAKQPPKLPLSLVSFGYRFGLPPQADLVFDVRFLPNPYFKAALKSLDGSHPKVRNFVLRRKETRRFTQQVVQLLNFLLPRYAKEGKSYLTIALGCTGGRHRSVALARHLEDYFSRKGYWTNVEHRDIHKN